MRTAASAARTGRGLVGRGVVSLGKVAPGQVRFQRGDGTGGDLRLVGPERQRRARDGLAPRPSAGSAGTPSHALAHPMPGASPPVQAGRPQARWLQASGERRHGCSRLTLPRAPGPARRGLAAAARGRNGLFIPQFSSPRWKRTPGRGAPLPRLTTPRATEPRRVLPAARGRPPRAGGRRVAVSMPTGGPVFSYPVTQGTAAQNEPNVQIQPKPPGANWRTPQEMRRGGTSASASYGSHPGVVKLRLLSRVGTRPGRRLSTKPARLQGKRQAITARYKRLSS